MAKLTIWEQRALAGKEGVHPEAGYTKILRCNNPKEIQKRIYYDLFFIYWDDENLNETFKFLYNLKFQIGKFFGQVLPRPLWDFWYCRRHDLTVSQEGEESEENDNSKPSELAKRSRALAKRKKRRKRQVKIAKKFISNKNFKKLIHLSLIWITLFLFNLFRDLFLLPLSEGIKDTAKCLLEIFLSIAKLILITLHIMLGNPFEDPKSEIIAISQILGIITNNRRRISSLSHHAPPKGLSITLYFIISFILFWVGAIVHNSFKLSDYLLNQVRLLYGVTNFWQELWTALNSSHGNTESSVYIVLLLSFAIWIIIDLLGTLFIFFLSIGVSIKIASKLRESKFSESACVLESLRILIELERVDALSYPLQRKYLMIRMNYLSSMSLLIPKNYPGNRYRKAWVNNQFRSISAFIQDRQCWLYAPGETTLQDLRRDFHMLARMYIDGSYGSFPYSEEFQPKPVPARKRWLQTIVQWLGFLTPLGLIASALLFPGNLPTSLQSTEIQEVLVWLGTAWLLIGIDRYLNLGVLDSIVDLASGLKGLK